MSYIPALLEQGADLGEWDDETVGLGYVLENLWLADSGMLPAITIGEDQYFDRTRRRKTEGEEPHNHSLRAEESLREQVQVVLPNGPRVGAGVNVPNVGNAFILQVTMDSLANPDEAVFVSARDPENL